MGRYWLTPSMWKEACDRCDTPSSAVAFRFKDHSRICARCIEKLGVKALPSKRWEEGGAKAGAAVTVRFECPICGGPHSRSEHLAQAA